jgi:hypothetical protein
MPEKKKRAYHKRRMWRRAMTAKNVPIHGKYYSFLVEVFAWRYSDLPDWNEIREKLEGLIEEYTGYPIDQCEWIVPYAEVGESEDRMLYDSLAVERGENYVVEEEH